MALQMKPLLFNNGHAIPRLGVGTFMLMGDKCQEVVTRALELGYRHVDSAYAYGNEKDIGTAVKQCIKKGLMKRRDVFITTKIPSIYLSPKDIKVCIEESQENFQLQYIDLVLIHHPWGLKNHGDGNLRPLGPDGYHLDYELYDLNASWAAMENSVQDRKVRSIGLSNVKASTVRDIVRACKIRPQNLQFECHAYYQQNELKGLCKEFGIVPTGYSPLGAPGRPQHHFTEQNKAVRLLDDPLVASIASKYDKTPAQVLIRFLLQQNFVTVPKASSEKRLIENLDVMDFEISAEDMKALKNLDSGLRYFTFLFHRKHPDFPKDGEAY